MILRNKLSNTTPSVVLTCHVPWYGPGCAGAVKLMLSSVSWPAGTWGKLVGLVPPIRLPVPIKFSVPAQAQVPTFLMRHVLTNCAPGAICELSGMVASATKRICAQGAGAGGAAGGAVGGTPVGVTAGA